MGGDFIYIVFSKDRPAKIDQVRSLVGELFEDIHWFVADGNRKAYEKAGACNVRETGRISQTLQRAVKVGTNQKRTVVFMADDLHGFYRLDPDVSKWVCSAGRRISLPDMANTLLTEMRLVGALAHPWVGSTQKAMRWNNSNGLPRPTAIIAAWISLLSTHH
jgi:hypothetical protein